MTAALLVWLAPQFIERPLAQDVGRIDGWAAHRNELAVWGERVVRIAAGRVDIEPARAARYTTGGALWSDGLVLNEAEPRPVLALYRGSRREVIATGVEAADLVPTRLFGRDGLLAIHKRAQLRFYWREKGGWQERTMYSFYHSGQGGLALADVDGDRRIDIFCGNYWVQSPRSFDLHWRLFAINTWYETDDAPSMRLAVDGNRLWVAQRALDRARLSVFQKPPDPKQLWRERRLREDLDRPTGLAVADLDGDGALDVAVGESGGATRLLLYTGGVWRVIRQGQPVLGLHAIGGELVVIGSNSVTALVPRPAAGRKPPSPAPSRVRGGR
jgi:hypothetical protein